MDLKIDATKIKALRAERSWSQEHLAAASGLSLRTVQRMETEGNASAESRLALAATFGVDPTELLAATPPGDPGLLVLPRNDRNRFLRLAVIYSLVCTGLCALDLSQTGSITWSRWPLLGMGIGLVSLGGKAFGARFSETHSRFARHAAIYLLVCTGLCALDVSQNGAITWSKWPFLGWGIGLMSHALKVIWPESA